MQKKEETMLDRRASSYLLPVVKEQMGDTFSKRFHCSKFSEVMSGADPSREVISPRRHNNDRSPRLDGHAASLLCRRILLNRATELREWHGASG